MQESFVHFIWQYQYFTRQDFCTTEGEPVVVLRQGMYNSQDSGPDFKGVKLRIGEVDWYGDVEIHLKASDWQCHNHQRDPAYNSVVLHVVWEEEGSFFREDGSKLPQVVLKDKVAPNLVDQYQQLMESARSIPCSSQFPEVSSLAKISMLDKALLQRLKRKAASILSWVAETGGDWETVAYWLMAQNFGFKKNNEPMLSMAKRLPLQLLSKHRNQPAQQEALVFGVAGFLENVPSGGDPYLKLLEQEWSFLGKKYQLLSKALQRHEWKFLRMRPANFPPVRLSQLAALLQSQHHLFSLFSREESVERLLKILRVPQSPYWQQHYDIGKESKNKIPALGLSSAQNLLINTAAPLLAAYGTYTDQESWVDRSMQLLQQLPAEYNHIMHEWEITGLSPQHAFDSQALIELYNEFCLPKKCLQCSVGLEILKREEV